MTKLHRDKNGRFTKLAPIGTLAYFSNVDKNGKPSYNTGWWIVVGSGPNGVVSCVPWTSSPIKSHMATFNLTGPDKMNITSPQQLDTEGLMKVGNMLELGINLDAGQNPTYYGAAHHAIAQLALAAGLIKH